MKACLVFLAALIAIVLTPLLALAQEASGCAPWPVIQEQLADRYGEALFFTGTTPDGFRMHVFAGPGGTWTLIVRDAAGEFGCLFAQGESWVGFAPPAQGEEG